MINSSNYGKKVDTSELLGTLNDIEDKYSPRTIYYKGDRNLIDKCARVSIIGTRKPSSEGISNAKAIVKYLVDKGTVIVSGLALGIDSVAHKTAIENSGKTIGVIGTPLNQYYPHENRELQDEIGQNHLLISQFEPGHPIQRHNFPKRNRTMALVSHASVIVEAGVTSGTQHQGWEALRLGRPLFIMESIAKDKSLKWPQKLLEYGAQSLSLSNLDVLTEELPNPALVISNGFNF
jgi:DNA processing protein